MTIVGTFLQSLLTIATVWVGKQALPLERPTTPLYIVSVAQFRPEKVLSLSLLASTHLLLHFPQTTSTSSGFVQIFVSSCVVSVHWSLFPMYFSASMHAWGFIRAFWVGPLSSSSRNAMKSASCIGPGTEPVEHFFWQRAVKVAAYSARSVVCTCSEFGVGLTGFYFRPMSCSLKPLSWLWMTFPQLWSQKYNWSSLVAADIRKMRNE